MGMRQRHVHVDDACCKSLGLLDASKLLVGNGGTRQAVRKGSLETTVEFRLLGRETT